MQKHSTISLSIGLILQWTLSIYCLREFSDEFQIKFILIISSTCLTTISALIEIFTKETYFSIFTIPGAIILMLCAHLSFVTVPGSYFGQTWFRLHLILSITGECFFFLAALASLTYFRVVKRLKKKNRIKDLSFFPPLKRIEELTRKFIQVGTFFFFFGLTLGFYGQFSQFNFFEPGLKHVLSLVVFIYFAIISIFNSKLKLAGNRLATLAMFGFILSLILIIFPGNANHWAPNQLSQKELIK